jgi:potassium/chloride transporter 9
MTDADDGAQTIRRLPTRTRSNFAARTARDETERLHRRSFAQHWPPPTEATPLLPESSNVRHPQNDEGAVVDTDDVTSFVRSLKAWLAYVIGLSKLDSSQLSSRHGKRQSNSETSKPRPGAFPRPVGGNGKLGTFAGVFVPVTLNVLSILMFLRFGFILGQAGLVGMMGMLTAGYLINLLTVMSISAIATNGTVRGGGAYCT